ncbi:hypothetical protein, partial [Streptomyces griseiscabiei]|uniref:hypothetical protein n=1 Tax=Streptomyces griseiscabiei TaxID=2993540 RepID=UPI000A39AA42
MTPEELEERVSTLEVINGELDSRLARQSGSLSQIDTKSVFLVGFVATASQFLATQDYQRYVGAAAFAAYAVAFAAGLSAFRIRDYDDLKPREVLDHNGREPKSKVLMGLAATRIHIFESNATKLDRKARSWTIGLWALVIGLVLSTVSLVLHTDPLPGSVCRSCGSVCST